MTNTPVSPSATSDDPRAQRSRQRLADALRTMLQAEDLGDIGVAELCRAAGVHRTTFYGHYASVGDLAADVYATMLDEASAVEPFTASPSESSQVYVDQMVELLDAVLRERTAIRALLESSVSLGFRKRLRQRYLDRMQMAVDVLRANGADVPEDSTVGVAFMAGGIASALELWAASDDTDSRAFGRQVLASMPRWWPSPA
ncbi:TetR/AcrR family transcriptional regulator [Microbacterium indicum]|uniref:TetR/AcrR family transcriptional regulator n=1 Tax=Microbacterium indicum TaxID=358100 RepID=UPI000408D1F4|nr:TetR/AcrR family transcriptional regulator [Microbacterium indicum]